MECLLLSADGDISLYEISSDLLEKIDNCVKQFDKWRKTKSYDETLFVQYLKQKYGEKSILFCKTVGVYCGKINQVTGQIEHDLPEEYRDTKWINF